MAGAGVAEAAIVEPLLRPYGASPHITSHGTNGAVFTAANLQYGLVPGRAIQAVKGSIFQVDLLPEGALRGGVDPPGDFGRRGDPEADDLPLMVGEGVVGRRSPSNAAKSGNDCASGPTDGRSRRGGKATRTISPR